MSESFYRLATRFGARRARLRRALKAAEHLPGTLRLRRRAGSVDLQHWQWLWLEAVSARLLPRERPQVLTMHNVIRRERPGRRLAERMDATIVHTRRGAELLGGGPRVHVIPHGAFEHLTRQPDERPLPRRAGGCRGPGRAVLRRRAAVQGRRRADRGVPVGRGRRAMGGRAAAWRVARGAGRARERALRAALRERRRAARLLPPRRPARAAAPDGRRLGGPLRRARVRQADGAVRRRRIPRAGRGARRRAARAAGRPRGAGARRSARCWPTKTRASASPSGRARPPPARTRGTRSRSGRTAVYEEVLA